MKEDVEDVFAPEDIDAYRSYWEARTDPAARMQDMEEEDYLAVVNICILKQEYDKAAMVLEEALGHYPNDDELLFSKVELLASTEKIDEAFKVLDDLDAWYPNNEERLAVRAGLYMSQERYEESERLFRQYERLGGDSGIVAAGLAQCLAVRGQRTEGFRRICQYLKSEPDSAEVCNRFIIWVIEWEMLEEAAEVLRKLTAEQPYNKYLWKLLYEISEMLEDYEGAKEANEYTLAIDPDDYEAHGRRILYSDMCDAASVEESFNRFKPERWTSTQRFYFYNVMADYYAEHEQPEREIFYIRELLKEPLEVLETAVLNYRLASRVFKRDEAAALREALFYFRKAAEGLRTIEKPDSMLLSDVHRGMGQCLLLLGEETQGIDTLREAWRIDSENEVAVFDYFLNLCIVGDLDRALADIEIGLSEDSRNNRYKLLKAVIFHYMRKPKQAETWFRAAFSADRNLIPLAGEIMPDIMELPMVRRILADSAD
ncbi:MAG: tetratricopeptide repeat protein [Bacteroidales bacterium]|nr:tetratricopeptide repeat protein [Bacteroidales bacterium]